MRIEIGNDRRVQERRQDPVIGGKGVFGQLREDELSEVEKRRQVDLSERVAKLEARPLRVWLPKDIMRSLTRLYRKFGKPTRR